MELSPLTWLEFDKIPWNARAHKFAFYPAGAIMPDGWIKAQMERDLEVGTTGNYDKLDETVNRDLFALGKTIATIIAAKTASSGRRAGSFSPCSLTMSSPGGARSFRRSKKP